MTVSSGDEFTGMPHGTPTTKNTKGIVLAEAVERNSRQLSLDFGASYPRPVAPPSIVVPNAPLTMLFMMRTVSYTFPNEPTKTEYRAELSTPRRMDGKYINAWHERILLPIRSGDDDTPVGRTTPGSSPDFASAVDINVPVKRKKGA